MQVVVASLADGGFCLLFPTYPLVSADRIGTKVLALDQQYQRKVLRGQKQDKVTLKMFLSVMPVSE